MPRPRRKISPQGIYHVLQRGIDKRDLFLDNFDYLFYLKCLYASKQNWSFMLYGFCLMENHVHLLLQVDSLTQLALIMQYIGQDYARWHNFKYERTGHLFDNRYRSHPLDDHSQVISTLHYIHHNPVRAALSKSCDNYPWSSQHAYTASYNTLSSQNTPISFKSPISIKSPNSNKLPHPDLVLTHWLHLFYPTEHLYQQYMALNPVANYGQLPLTDSEYYSRISDIVVQVKEIATQQGRVRYESQELPSKRRMTLSACIKYWAICRIYESNPTTTRQLGRVLGHSHNVIIRALASESLVPGKTRDSRAQ